MAVSPEEARKELARRELERRKAQTEAPEPPGFALGSPGPTIIDSMLGLGDVLNTTARGAVGRFAGGLAAAPVAGDVEAREKIFEKVTSAPAFNRPLTTPAGQAIGQKLGAVGEKIDTGITDAFGVLPGGPAVQAGARTIVQAPLELLGLRQLFRGGASAVRNAGRAPTSPRPPSPITPEVDDLFNAGRVAFNEARLNGGGIKPDVLDGFATKIRTLKDDRTGLKIRFSERTEPKSAGIRADLLDDLDSRNVNFDELMEIREIATRASISPDAAERRLSGILRNEIDKFVDSLGPDDVISGNPQQAAQALNTARQLWRDASKARTIERMIEVAEDNASQFSGSGLENALRTQFRQLSRRIKQGKEFGWTPEEAAAIQLVARGGPIDNVFRFIGKAAPTGIVSGGIGFGAGAMVGGPVLGAAVPITGAIGRKLAERSTIRNAQSALNLPLQRSLINP